VKKIRKRKITIITEQFVLRRTVSGGAAPDGADGAAQALPVCPFCRTPLETFTPAAADPKALPPAIAQILEDEGEHRCSDPE